ncbi:hypothetical protein H4219_002092 [Mycoemilia scoparia]|uniref:Ubiquitin-like protease family profile domain-containing protein n=1 Tax=Mycoemilia scoparia TaxID=417184 RepID=A0A9W8A3C1_9FUNG|nr:hypothetical protein H4219_002092 [Mycoemilia scoparia]
MSKGGPGMSSIDPGIAPKNPLMNQKVQEIESSNDEKEEEEVLDRLAKPTPLGAITRSNSSSSSNHGSSYGSVGRADIDSGEGEAEDIVRPKNPFAAELKSSKHQTTLESAKDHETTEIPTPVLFSSLKKDKDNQNKANTCEKPSEQPTNANKHSSHVEESVDLTSSSDELPNKSASCKKHDPGDEDFVPLKSLRRPKSLLNTKFMPDREGKETQPTTCLVSRMRDKFGNVASPKKTPKRTRVSEPINNINSSTTIDLLTPPPPPPRLSIDPASTKKKVYKPRIRIPLLGLNVGSHVETMHVDCAKIYRPVLVVDSIQKLFLIENSDMDQLQIPFQDVSNVSLGQYGSTCFLVMKTWKRFPKSHWVSIYYNPDRDDIEDGWLMFLWKTKTVRSSEAGLRETLRTFFSGKVEVSEMNDNDKLQIYKRLGPQTDVEVVSLAEIDGEVIGELEPNAGNSASKGADDDPWKPTPSPPPSASSAQQNAPSSTNGTSRARNNVVESPFCFTDNGYQRIRKWTKKVDIFSRPYIFVPINENFHWYLAIIYNPGLLINPASKDSPMLVDTPKESPTYSSNNNTPTTAVDDENSKVFADTDSIKLNEKAANDNNGNDIPKEILSKTENSNDEELEEVISTGSVKTQPETNPIKDALDAIEKTQQASLGVEQLTTSSKVTTSPTAVGSDNNDKKLRQEKLTKSKYEEVDPEKQPFIFIFDSLGGVHPKTFSVLNSYLAAEAKERHNVGVNGKVKGVYAKVPRQPNTCDCGLFLLQYVEEFLQHPKDCAKKIANRDSLRTNWFEVRKVMTKRREIRNLIDVLSEQYQIHLANQGSDKVEKDLDNDESLNNKSLKEPNSPDLTVAENNSTGS